MDIRKKGSGEMMYLVDSGEISLYSGILPDHISLNAIGVDWCIFDAASTDDAWEQASKFELGVHHDFERICQTCSDIRQAYEIDTNLAYQLFSKAFPYSSLSVTLKLEAIGDDARQFYRDFSSDPFLKSTLFGDGGNPFRRPWVAEITGDDPKYKFKRVFLKGRKDYSEAADKKGSRGVYYYYTLEPGKIYQINDLVSWKITKRYFARVLAGEIIEMTEDEVRECLREALE